LTLKTLVERGQVHGCSVGKRSIRLVPDILGWVELGGVCWEAVDVQAATIADELLDFFTPVDRPLIPHQNHGTPQVTKQVVDKRLDVEAGEIPGSTAEIEGHPPAFGRYGQGTDDRDPVLLVEMVEDRGPAFGGPAATDVGNEQEPALVHEDEMGPKCALFFLSGAIPFASTA